MEDPLEYPLALVIGPIASWEAYDLSQSPKRKAAINKRVLKYTSLTRNLTKMMASGCYFDPYTVPMNLDLVFDLHIVNLGSRLTWIMMYFYGAMVHYATWIFNQTQVNSVAQTHAESWITFLESLSGLHTLLARLPTAWLRLGLGHIIDDAGQEQIIPAEPPLELVAQIHLFIPHALSHYQNLDTAQATLKKVAQAFDYPAGYDTDNHDGFSNCIFVAQSRFSSEQFIVGSTVMYLGYIDVEALTTSFTSIRRRRFVQGEKRYDHELGARFCNHPDTELTTPEKRYRDVGHTRDQTGTVLAEYANRVRTRLIDEYAGHERTTVAGSPYPDYLPLTDRKIWVPFRYARHEGRAFFASIVHRNQSGWFEPTPRCMKCRVIHDYYIEHEDLQVQAPANKSCQCAEDIVYAKLREIFLVENVVLLYLR